MRAREREGERGREENNKTNKVETGLFFPHFFSSYKTPFLKMSHCK